MKSFIGKPKFMGAVLNIAVFYATILFLAWGAEFAVEIIARTVLHADITGLINVLMLATRIPSLILLCLMLVHLATREAKQKDNAPVIGDGSGYTRLEVPNLPTVQTPLTAQVQRTAAPAGASAWQDVDLVQWGRANVQD